jgi:S1-C subfamily serine protease
MLTRLAALVVSLALISTTPVPPVTAEDLGPMDFPYTFSLIPPLKGYGHGCAVEGITITNRHMVDFRKDPTDELKATFFRYGFPNGRAGRGKAVSVSEVADLAVVLLDIPASQFGTLAKAAPEIGDVVRWVEYDFRKLDKVFHGRVREGKIVTNWAGHVVLDEDITRGASGGCAYNEAGEIVGLMTFGVNTEDRKIGAGIVALWGDWWKDVAP